MGRDDLPPAEIFFSFSRYSPVVAALRHCGITASAFKGFKGFKVTWLHDYKITWWPLLLKTKGRRKKVIIEKIRKKGLWKRCWVRSGENQRDGLPSVTQCEETFKADDRELPRSSGSDSALVDIFRQEMKISKRRRLKGRRCWYFPASWRHIRGFSCISWWPKSFTAFQTLSFGQESFRRCVVLANMMVKEPPEMTEGQGSEHETLKENQILRGTQDQNCQTTPLSASKLDDIPIRMYHWRRCLRWPGTQPRRRTLRLSGDATKPAIWIRFSKNSAWSSFTKSFGSMTTTPSPVMNDPDSATEVLRIKDPLVTIKTFSDASDQSKLKAKAVGLGVVVTGRRQRPKPPWWRPTGCYPAPSAFPSRGNLKTKKDWRSRLFQNQPDHDKGIHTDFSPFFFMASWVFQDVSTCPRRIVWNIMSATLTSWAYLPGKIDNHVHRRFMQPKTYCHSNMYFYPC